jgi:hypothetical protein
MIVDLIDGGGNTYRISGPRSSVKAFLACAIRRGATRPEDCFEVVEREPRDRRTSATPQTAQATTFAEVGD